MADIGYKRRGQRIKRNEQESGRAGGGYWRINDRSDSDRRHKHNDPPQMAPDVNETDFVNMKPAQLAPNEREATE